MKESESQPATSVQSMPRSKLAGTTNLYALAAFVALAGLFDALYLTIEHLQGRSVRCTATSGCSEVLGSHYAVIGGVPLAAVGAIAYFTVFSLATLIAFGHTRLRSVFRIIVGLMCGTSLWLLYVQAFVLKAFCQYCLLSAGLSLVLGGIVIVDWFLHRGE
ncbi:MAG: vitamin K epoxide reductase family protein [Pyrinomonadaceae bacterium]|nr:vitamin K epoxide reductase family protein [Pyrinomonadaceae bacterium]